jgi:hypothetical protein
VQARNISHLKAVLTSAADEVSTLPARPILEDQDTSEEGGEEYEVERLTGCRRVDDRLQFRVRYTGWPGWYWADELDLSCPELIQKYFKKMDRIGSHLVAPRPGHDNGAEIEEGAEAENGGRIQIPVARIMRQGTDEEEDWEGNTWLGFGEAGSDGGPQASPDGRADRSESEPLDEEMGVRSHNQESLDVNWDELT